MERRVPTARNVDCSKNLTVDPESPTGGYDVPLDPYIGDYLAEDFERKVHIDEVVMEENSDVLAYRGFYDLSANQIKDPRWIIDAKHAWEANPDMNSHLWLTNSGERVHYGFRGEELITAKALSLDYRPIKPNNLDIDIHPLLRLDHWNNTPDDIYEVLKPALRLATMFLSNERCMRWWSCMLLGEREPDISGTMLLGQPVQRIKAPVPITPGNSFKAIEYLREKGEDVVEGEGHLISFRFRDDLWHPFPEGARVCFGITSHIGSWEGPLPLERKWTEIFTKKKMNRAIVRLHADFYVEACKLRDLKYPDENQKLRFYLFFAVILCHEIAHAIEVTDIFHGSDIPFFVPEPFVGNIRARESGNVWEKFTFGGRLWPINGDMSCKYGLCTQSWPCPPEDREWQNTLYSIPMDWIEKIQQQSFWDESEDILTGEPQRALEEWLYPPKRQETAKAWGDAIVLNMPESEFFRVLQEEFEEKALLKEKKDKEAEAALRQMLQEELERERERERGIQVREAAAWERDAAHQREEAEQTKIYFRRQRQGMRRERSEGPVDDVFDRITEPQPPLRLRRPASHDGLARSRSPRRRPKTEAEERMESRRAGTRKPKVEPYV